MYIWPKEIQQIIAEVLHAQNPITCLEKFKNYEPAKKLLFYYLMEIKQPISSISPMITTFRNIE